MATPTISRHPVVLGSQVAQNEKEISIDVRKDEQSITTITAPLISSPPRYRIVTLSHTSHTLILFSFPSKSAPRGVGKFQIRLVHATDLERVLRLCRLFFTIGKAPVKPSGTESQAGSGVRGSQGEPSTSAQRGSQDRSSPKDGCSTPSQAPITQSQTSAIPAATSPSPLANTPTASTSAPISPPVVSPSPVPAPGPSTPATSSPTSSITPGLSAPPSSHLSQGSEGSTPHSSVPTRPQTLPKDTHSPVRKDLINLESQPTSILPTNTETHLIDFHTSLLPLPPVPPQSLKRKFSDEDIDADQDGANERGHFKRPRIVNLMDDVTEDELIQMEMYEPLVPDRLVSIDEGEEMVKDLDDLDDEFSQSYTSPCGTNWTTYSADLMSLVSPIKFEPIESFEAEETWGDPYQERDVMQPTLDSHEERQDGYGRGQGKRLRRRVQSAVIDTRPDSYGGVTPDGHLDEYSQNDEYDYQGDHNDYETHGPHAQLEFNDSSYYNQINNYDAYDSNDQDDVDKYDPHSQLRHGDEYAHHPADNKRSEELIDDLEDLDDMDDNDDLDDLEHLDDDLDDEGCQAVTENDW